MIRIYLYFTIFIIEALCIHSFLFILAISASTLLLSLDAARYLSFISTILNNSDRYLITLAGNFVVSFSCAQLSTCDLYMRPYIVATVRNPLNVKATIGFVLYDLNTGFFVAYYFIYSLTVKPNQCYIFILMHQQWKKFVYIIPFTLLGLFVG